MSSHKTQRAIGYCRVSTKEQGANRNGLDAQALDIKRFCEANGIELIECVEEVASGKCDLTERPVLADTIKRCKDEGAILICSKLDRFSRSVEFTSAIVNTFKRQGIKFVSCDLGLEAETLFLHVLISFAEREREIIGQRTKKGLEQLRARGVTKTGRVALANGSIMGAAMHSDGGVKARAAAKAALIAKSTNYANSVRHIIEPMRKSGLTFKEIAARLTTQNMPTQNGGLWSTCSVRNIVIKWN